MARDAQPGARGARARARGRARAPGTLLRVQQVVGGAGPVDAVTNQALAYRRLFGAWGWGGRDWAAWAESAVAGRFNPLRELAAEPDDVLLVHFSGYTPGLRELLARPNPKLVVYHNVTPARWLWKAGSLAAVHAAAGRAQLPDLARAVDLAAGVSEFNTRELAEAGARETAVLPILLDSEPLGAPGEAEPDGAPVVLFVGRLAPHKRHDEVIRAFCAYRTLHAAHARLVLVGEPVSVPYRAALESLAQSLAPDAVSFERSLSPAALGDRYRSAHAFLCLSEHEGFCVPLLEAFRFGVPVISRPAGGIREVAGDAALLVEDRDPVVVAELLRLVVEDRELRAELRARGRARLADFDPGAVARRIRAAVERAAG